MSRFCLLLLWLFPITAVAETLTLVMPVGGYPPYAYQQEDKYFGIFNHLLQVNANEQLQFDYHEVPRNRLDKETTINTSWLRIASPKWISGDFLVSKPFSEYRDIFFSHEENAKSIDRYEQLIGKSICTNAGFIYSETLMAHFASGQITRMDAPSDSVKINMFIHNRCDFLLGEQSVIAYQMLDIDSPLFASNLVDAVWPISFIVHPEREDLLTLFNQMIEEGLVTEQVEQLKIEFTH